MSDDMELPPPPPDTEEEVEDIGAPPAEDPPEEEVDEVNEDEDELLESEILPPPAPYNEFAMTHEQARDSGRSSAVDTIQQIGNSGYKADDLNQSSDIVFFQLAIFFNDWDTHLDEEDDHEYLSIADATTPQVIAFAAEVGVEVKKNYSGDEILAIINKKVDLVLGAAEDDQVEVLIPALLRFASHNLKLKSSLSSNMAYRASISFVLPDTPTKEH